MHYMRENYAPTRAIAQMEWPGLYIELKEPEWYLDKYGIDMSEVLYDFLKLNGLETVEKATANKIPIVIQSFSEPSLKQFAEYSDLPRVKLMSPDVQFNAEHIASYAHGIGPDTDLVMFWPDMDK